MIQLIKVWF